MIGFWAFVSGILYNQEATTAVESEPAPVIAKPANVTRISHNALNTKQQNNITNTERPQTATETLADLLQCAEVHKPTQGDATVKACPPLRRHLQHALAVRGNRQLDAREAAQRLATGWQTGVSQVETGSLPNGQ